MNVCLFDVFYYVVDEYCFVVVDVVDVVFDCVV